MKNLFYLLIVLNVVFFVWKNGLEPHVSDPATATAGSFSFSDGGDRQLTLPAAGPDIAPATPPADAAAGQTPTHQVAEGGEGPADFAEPEKPLEPLLQSADGCYEIGPILTREAAEAYLGLIGSSVQEARVVIKTGAVPDGWWVLYPKARTLEGARANRRLLAKYGVFDSWIFDKGPLALAISLGLYKTRGEAEQAAKPLMDRGVIVEVAPRRVRGEVFALKLNWSGLPLELDEKVQLLNSQDSALQMPAPSQCH
jgi:hypothetical protein